MLVMMPIIIVLISGLFVKTSADTINIITKLIVSSIASFIQIIVANILIILFLYLYGNNEEKISKRSLKQEIENL
jgi:riboflavin transporter FmnP